MQQSKYVSMLSSCFLVTTANAPAVRMQWWII